MSHKDTTSWLALGELDEEVELSGADLAGLLSEGALEPADSEEDIADLLSSSADLHAVTQRIAGQYADVLARYSTALFSGKDPSELPDMAYTLDNLLRLATSAGETTLVELLSQFKQIVEKVQATPNPTLRQRHLNALRDWVHAFSEILEPEDGRRLVSTVAWQAGAAPLLDELRSIRGIGPKRLARLYRAGLYTVEVVANAQPDEVAVATGIPRTLARDVVEASRTFAEAERMRCAVEMRERAARFRQILQRVVLSEDPEILNIARTALQELEKALTGEEEG